MRYSKLFGKTERKAPADHKFTSHKLLYRAGFVRESTAGRYYFLPLGMRVRDKIAVIVEEEMDAVGAQKMLVPVLHPVELWRETNRTDSTGFELMTVKDRRGAEFALGGTAEEMFVELVRKLKLSYKDLPFNVYQFSSKFRDELRARGGLLRVREFTMKDAYSFHRDEKSFKKTYALMAEKYKIIFERVGLVTQMVESDNGYIGGEYSHEFIVESEVGESRYFVAGNYAAHEDVARFVLDKKNASEKLKKMVEIEAKRGPTMEDGVKLHKLPLWQQIKDLMLVDEDRNFILAVIRGDLDVNVVKVARLTGAHSLRHAEDKEIVELGSHPGFISPVKINKKVKVVCDVSLKTIANAYTGANRKNLDLVNVNYGRDFKGDIEGDISMAKDGYIAENGKQLKARRGIEVGNIFQLGYHYTNLMKGATFTDEDGKQHKYYMGCYGIGLGRTLAAIVEVYNDGKGIKWPVSVAPHQVQLVDLANRESRQVDGQAGVRKNAEKVYKGLIKEGIEVLWDDREESAGVKFADADLIGTPVRLVVSRATKDKVEWKRRDEDKVDVISIQEAIGRIKKINNY